MPVMTSHNFVAQSRQDMNLAHGIQCLNLDESATVFMFVLTKQVDPDYRLPVSADIDRFL